MGKKYIILIALWVTYLLLMEACFLIWENYRPKDRSSSWKPKKIQKITRWTRIISTAAIIAYTVKLIIT